MNGWVDGWSPRGKFMGMSVGGELLLLRNEYFSNNFLSLTRYLEIQRPRGRNVRRKSTTQRSGTHPRKKKKNLRNAEFVDAAEWVGTGRGCGEEDKR